MTVLSELRSFRDGTARYPKWLRNYFCDLLMERLPDLFCNQSPRPLFNQNWDGYRLEYLLRRFALRDVATGRMAS